MNDVQQTKCLRWLAAAILLVGCSLSAPLSAQEQNSAFLDGVSVYDTTELLVFAAHLSAVEDGRVDIRELAAAIERIYVEDGYFLAHAFVEEDGSTITVHEGSIRSVEIVNSDPSTYNLIRQYFEPLIGRSAITIDEFERAVLLSDDLETVAVTAELSQQEGHGADVRIVTTQEDDRRGWVTIDNPAREFGDAVTVSINQEFYEAVTAGDMLRMSITHTLGFDPDDAQTIGSITYRTPLGGSGAYLEGSFSNSAATHDAFGALPETHRDGRTGMLAFGFPVVRTVDRYAYFLLEGRASSSDLSFGGTTNEEELASVSASWIDGRALSSGGALEFAVSVTAGSQTIMPSGVDNGDEDYTVLRAGFDAEVPLLDFSYTTLRLDMTMQVSPDRLPHAEEFFLGGREQLRGYRFAEAQGDTGISASLSIGRDFIPSGGALQRVRPFGFIDMGYVENNAPGLAEIADQTLFSMGIGVEAQFNSYYFIRGHLGFPMVDGVTQTTRDPAIYLGITRSW